MKILKEGVDRGVALSAYYIVQFILAVITINRLSIYCFALLDDIVNFIIMLIYITKQKHLGCKKIARPRRNSIVNKSATKSSDIR